MKKVLLIFMLSAMTLILSACFEGVVNSELTITDANGAGSRTISAKIYKDGVLKPDLSGELVGEYDGGPSLMSDHLPNGTAGVRDKLIDVNQLPDADIDLLTDPSWDYDLITITYEFDNIAEYNTKTRALAAGAPIIDAELIVDGNELIFMEPAVNFDNAIRWAVDAVFQDTNVYVPLNTFSDASTIARLEDMKVNLMGEEYKLQKPVGFPDEQSEAQVTGKMLTAVKLLGPLDDVADPAAVSTGHNNLKPPYLGTGMPLKAEINHEWTEMFNRDTGWLGADGIYSIPLNGVDSIGSATAETKTFWTFSDTNLGRVDPSTKEFSFHKMAYNTIGIMTGNEPIDANMEYTFGYRGDGTYNSQSIYGYDGVGHKLWPVDGIVIDDILYMSGHRTDEYLVPFDIEEIKIPIVDGVPDIANYELRKVTDELMFQDEEWEIIFGTAILDNTTVAGAPDPDGYVYIYGFRNDRITAFKGIVVARVLREDFLDYDEWEFYDGTDWHDDMMVVHDDDAMLAFNLSVELSVTPITSGVYEGKYMLVYTKDVITPYLEYRIGDSPIGPFGDPVHFYTALEPDIHGFYQHTFAYNAKAHPHLSKPGELLVSYNVNSFEFPPTNEIYRPRFVTLKLDEFATVPPQSTATTNVALGKTATASHFSSEASKAVDGNWEDYKTDMWIGPSLGNQWLQVDLGGNYDITRWAVKHASAAELLTAYNTRDFTLQRSSDGITWHNVDSVAYNTEAVTDRTVAEFTARYVRLVITKPSQGTDLVARILEFEVYGEPASPPTSGTGTGTVTQPPAADPWELVDGVLEFNEDSIQAIREELSEGKTKLRLNVDNDSLLAALARLEQEDGGNRIVIGTDENPSELSVALPGEALYAAASIRDLIFIVKAGNTEYRLPAGVIDWEGLTEQLNAESGDIVIELSIAEADKAVADAVAAEAQRQGMELVGSAVQFKLTGSNGEYSVDIAFGSAYVERQLTVNQDVNPEQATALIYNPETGAVRFVPAVIDAGGDKSEVTIKHNGNGIYALALSNRTFDDIQGHWAHKVVELLAAKQIATGINDRQFHPDTDITRAEFAALLIAGLGLAERHADGSFSDVPADGRHAGAIHAAAAAGLVEGYADGAFHPDDTLTREQMAAMLVRAMNYIGYAVDGTSTSGLAAFRDASAISDWAAPYIEVVLKAGIMQGTGNGEFTPGRNAARAHAATAIANMLEQFGFINSQ